MINKNDIRTWKTILNPQDWINVKYSLKNFRHRIFYLDQVSIIDDIENFLLQSSILKINKKDLEINKNNTIMNQKYYIHKFQYSFNEDIPYLDLFEYLPYYFRYNFLKHAVENHTFSFTIVKNFHNKMLLSISFEDKKNENSPFKIELFSHDAEVRTEYFLTTEEIEDYMQNNILLNTKSLHTDINVFYQDIFLGKLACSYRFKLRKIDEFIFEYVNVDNKNHDALEIYPYSEYLEGEYLPEYNIYICNKLKNIILVAEYEKENFETHHFLKVSTELLSNLDKLKKYIYEILWA